MRKTLRYTCLYICFFLGLLTIHGAEPSSATGTLVDRSEIEKKLKADATIHLSRCSEQKRLALALFCFLEGGNTTYSKFICYKNKLYTTPYEPHLIISVCLQEKNIANKIMVAAYLTDPICETCGFILYDILQYNGERRIQQNGCDNQKFPQMLKKVLFRALQVGYLKPLGDNKILLLKSEEKVINPSVTCKKNMSDASNTILPSLVEDKQNRLLTQTQKQDLLCCYTLKKNIEQGDLDAVKKNFKANKKHLVYKDKIAFIAVAHRRKKRKIFKYLVQQTPGIKERHAHDILWNLLIGNQDYDLAKWFVKTEKVTITSQIFKKLRDKREKGSAEAKAIIAFLKCCKNKKGKDKKKIGKKSNKK